MSEKTDEGEQLLVCSDELVEATRVLAETVNRLDDFDRGNNKLLDSKYFLNFDLSSMIDRLIKEDGFKNAYECELAFIEYKKFLLILILFGNSKSYFIPSQTVDKIWHKHILNTKQYKVCKLKKMCLVSSATHATTQFSYNFRTIFV